MSLVTTIENDACVPLKATCGRLMHNLFYSDNQVLRHVWHLRLNTNTWLNKRINKSRYKKKAKTLTFIKNVERCDVSEKEKLQINLDA